MHNSTLPVQFVDRRPMGKLKPPQWLRHIAYLFNYLCKAILITNYFTTDRSDTNPRVIGGSYLKESMYDSTEEIIFPRGSRVSSLTTAAQVAFQKKNAETSRKLHKNHPGHSAVEIHNKNGANYLKAFVFGGLDGIITTFAVVCSGHGANLSASIVLIMV